WMEHLDRMDMLRDGINLMGYGQRNPLAEYKIRALDMFENMEHEIMDRVANLMYHVSIVTAPMPLEGEEITQTADVSSVIEREKRALTDNLANARMMHGDYANDSPKKPKKNAEPKVGRNDPCPCGSGKKYKNCCGRNK
ncbi:MAG: SEC-C domain-containing protein, partial [Selenomonadaceae bacterium]|nr:SEC-C domain-containing protein [Selenomonadaceae bacterium]